MFVGKYPLRSMYVYSAVARNFRRFESNTKPKVLVMNLSYPYAFKTTI